MSEHFQAGPTILSSSQWLAVNPAAIPHELTDTAAWYPAIIRQKATQVGKWDKIPGDPQTVQPATWKDPSTRCTFGESFMAYESGRFAGVGYVMDASAGLIGIDLDTCVSLDGTVALWARQIVAQFSGAYWERSISGTGLRGFCRGVLPVGGCRSKVEGCSVELYADQRFLVVTGQTIQHTEVLPELQPAVDALHARLTAGRSRATGTAVTSGLTGPNTTPSPEVVQIITAVMSGPWGSRMMEIWSRDDLHVSGASEDDFALASEIAYQGIRLGHSGDTLTHLVEEAMRAGPYRAKWDERRGAVSWLAQDCANAVATVQARLAKNAGPIPILDDDETGQPPTGESLEENAARLEQELGQARAVIAQQQTVIRSAREISERAEAGKLAADELVRAMFDTISLPDDQMNARTKLVSLVLAREAASRNSRGIFTMANTTLGRLTGLDEKVVSQIMQDLPARDGTPFERIVTRGYVEVAPGITEPRSIAQVRITTPDQTTVSVIRALHSIGGPSDKEMQRLAKARAKTAANAEAKITTEVGKRIGWGWCSSHDNTDVLVRGFCPDCGEVVGERSMLVEEFSILNPEFRDSAVQPPLPVDVVTLPPEIRDSAGGEPLKFSEHRVVRETRTDGVRITRMEISEAAQCRDVDTTSTCRACGQYTVMRGPSGITTCAGCGGTIQVADWAQAQRQRCACGSLERNGDRCDGCGVRGLAAVSGGSE